MTRPLSNENVYNGLCINCTPSKVPLGILQQWNFHKLMASHRLPTHEATAPGNVEQAQLLGGEELKPGAFWRSDSAGNNSYRALATRSKQMLARASDLVDFEPSIDCHSTPVFAKDPHVVEELRDNDGMQQDEMGWGVGSFLDATVGPLQ